MIECIIQQDILCPGVFNTRLYERTLSKFIGPLQCGVDIGAGSVYSADLSHTYLLCLNV